MAITNQKSWWKTVTDNWDDLIAIANRFLPMDKPVADCPPLAEACMVKFPDMRTTAQAFIEARDDRNHVAMSEFFEAAWERAPDNSGIHEIRGWDVLCDLCSETWVFDVIEHREHTQPY